MQTRRSILLATSAGLLAPALARAHHGWGSFDVGRPLYLEGVADRVEWRNPHVEVWLTLPADAKLPADLALRPLPPQSSPIDGPAILAKAVLPSRTDRIWELELAPLTRMQAWGVPEIKPSTLLSVVGYAAEGERGEPVARVEYLFVGGKAYGLRSAPART